MQLACPPGRGRRPVLQALPRVGRDGPRRSGRRERPILMRRIVPKTFRISSTGTYRTGLGCGTPSGGCGTRYRGRSPLSLYRALTAQAEKFAKTTSAAPHTCVSSDSRAISRKSLPDVGREKIGHWASIAPVSRRAAGKPTRLLRSRLRYAFSSPAPLRSAAMDANCSRAASRSEVISRARTSGSGRLAESSRLSSRSQKRSSPILSRLRRSS